MSPRIEGLRLHFRFNRAARLCCRVAASSNKILHEKVVIVNVQVLREPRVPPGERIQVESYGQGLYEVKLRYGFMQGFNIPSDLALCVERGDLPIDLDNAAYFVGISLPIT
jgi:KUP system potassium uptake protein